jgi:hypothetical protein
MSNLAEEFKSRIWTWRNTQSAKFQISAMLPDAASRLAHFGRAFSAGFGLKSDGSLPEIQAVNKNGIGI